MVIWTFLSTESPTQRATPNIRPTEEYCVSGRRAGACRYRRASDRNHRPTMTQRRQERSASDRSYSIPLHRSVSPSAWGGGSATNRPLDDRRERAGYKPAPTDAVGSSGAHSSCGCRRFRWGSDRDHRSAMPQLPCRGRFPRPPEAEDLQQTDPWTTDGRGQVINLPLPMPLCSPMPPPANAPRALSNPRLHSRAPSRYAHSGGI